MGQGVSRVAATAGDSGAVQIAQVRQRRAARLVQPRRPFQPGKEDGAARQAADDAGAAVMELAADPAGEQRRRADVPSSTNIIHAGQHLASEGWESVVVLPPGEGVQPGRGARAQRRGHGRVCLPAEQGGVQAELSDVHEQVSGHAMAHKRLPAGCTPEIYCSRDGAGAKFIIPGLTSVPALRQTLIVMAELLAPAANLPLSLTGAGGLGAAVRRFPRRKSAGRA